MQEYSYSLGDGIRFSDSADYLHSGNTGPKGRVESRSGLNRTVNAERGEMKTRTQKVFLLTPVETPNHVKATQPPVWIRFKESITKILKDLC